MAEERHTRSRAWVLALLGGAAVIVSAFLPWLDTGGVTVTTESVTGEPTGIDLTYGMVALVAGIAVVVFAFLMLIWPGPTRLWGVGSVLGGAVAIAMGALTMTTIRDTYISFVGAELGRPADEIRNSVDALFENGGLSEKIGIGTYIAMAGGLVALVGGFVAIFRWRRRTTVTSETHVEAAPVPQPTPATTASEGGAPAPPSTEPEEQEELGRPPAGLPSEETPADEGPFPETSTPTPPEAVGVESGEPAAPSEVDNPNTDADEWR